MDQLAGAAVEQVALSPDGCTVSQLWSALRHAAEEAGVQLDAPALRTAVWRLLNAEAGLSFLLPSGRKLAAGDEELASPAAAEAAGVLLWASQDLQDAAVGLFESKISRFPISVTERRMLALVGASKRRGAPQTDLAAALCVDHRGLSYLVKMLEQRGLVVKHATVVKIEHGGHTSHICTNLLHLPRFAPPDLPKGATLALSPAAAQCAASASQDGRSSPHAGGDGGQALGEDELAVLDDGSPAGHFASVSSYLQSRGHWLDEEKNLKASLGYSGSVGDRLWCFIRSALVGRGHIEEFLARPNDCRNRVKCIKLLKPWTGEESASESEGEDEEEGQGGGPPLGRQVAELTLDRQLLRELVAAASDGLLSIDVEATLRLNMKRIEARLKEAEARFGLSRRAAKQGRMIAARWTAPEALRERLSGEQEGWLAAGAGAMQTGLQGGEPARQQQQEQANVGGGATLDAAAATASAIGAGSAGAGGRKRRRSGSALSAADSRASDEGWACL